MHRVKLLLLFIIWLVSLASISFLVLPYKGELVGISIGLVYSIVVFALLDKWILLFLLAREASRGDRNYEVLNNLSYSQNTRGVRLYYSRVEIGNLLTLDWCSSICIILDERFKSQKVDAKMIEDSLLYIKSGKAKNSSWLAYMIAVYNVPLVILERLFGKLSIFSLITSIWVSPFQVMIDNHQKAQHRRRNLTFEGYNQGEFDSVTTLMLKTLGIYHVENKDLMNIVFSKEF